MGHVPIHIPKVIQLYDAYLVLETDEGMLVIDQHALHERILFEAYRGRISAGTLEAQTLLIPEPVDLPGEAAGRVLALFGVVVPLFGFGTPPVAEGGAALAGGVIGALLALRA